MAARPAGETGAGEFVCYDGPPFANGLPHYGHLLTGYVKDVVPRYQAMRGRRVERRFGWDCHGLPAEVEVERQLGITHKSEIERMGVAEFNAACRASVLRYTREWREYVTRQARWVDFDNDYKTLDLDYMESVLWAFKTLWDKGLIYQDFRVLWYCWRCETPLSNTETKMDDVYRNRQDPAVTVGLLGRRYTPPFDFFAGRANAHQLLAADYVTTDEGTGLVHLAPAFGEEDKAVTDAAGIETVVPVDSAGQFTADVPPYAGMQVFDANREIIRDLRDGAAHVGGVLLRHETDDHPYPHCWRCNNPLIQRAVSSWFVEVTKFRACGPRLGGDTQKVIRAVKAGEWERGSDGVVTAGGIPLLAEEYTERLVAADPRETAALPAGSGLVTDRIMLTVDAPEPVLAAAREYEAFIVGEVLARQVEYEPVHDGFTGIVGESVAVRVRVAAVSA